MAVDPNIYLGVVAIVLTLLLLGVDKILDGYDALYAMNNPAVGPYQEARRTIHKAVIAAKFIGWWTGLLCTWPLALVDPLFCVDLSNDS
jgi:hypothetical protein